MRFQLGEPFLELPDLLLGDLTSGGLCLTSGGLCLTSGGLGDCSLLERQAGGLLVVDDALATTATAGSTDRGSAVGPGGLTLEFAEWPSVQR